MKTSLEDVQPPFKAVVWFSCGAASAVALKQFVDFCKQFPDDSYALRAIRCHVANEHEDNDRFSRDVEKWVGIPIEVRASSDYKDCWDVWESRKYLAGRMGAPCTIELKKAVRWQVEKEFAPDIQVFGYTVDEVHRAIRFRNQNAEINLITPLIDNKTNKQDCFRIIQSAGIELPVMYKLGYGNNNCIGCVKGGAGYWNKIRKDFPDTFNRMAELEDRLGAKLVQVKGKRTKLKDLPEGAGRMKDFEIDCGILCHSEKD